ncbi:response regulator [candidate division KSB1 bacterium]|nr:response regulator [candidate division KSB1 bacterium]
MSKTIMTVDDSASIRQMVAFSLKQAGYNVIEAVDGADALNQLATKSIDMLVTDLNMPNVNGVELIRQVRKMTAYRFIPIIMLTTESQETKKSEGKAAGATAWVIKPFRPEQLIAIANKVLRR